MASIVIIFEGFPRKVLQEICDILVCCQDTSSQMRLNQICDQLSKLLRHMDVCCLRLYANRECAKSILTEARRDKLGQIYNLCNYIICIMIESMDLILNKCARQVFLFHTNPKWSLKHTVL